MESKQKKKKEMPLERHQFEKKKRMMPKRHQSEKKKRMAEEAFSASFLISLSISL